MAKYPLIARVPEIWRRLDSDTVSRRFFGAIDDELEHIGGTIEEYLKFVSIDKADDKFLPLIKDLVGHEWDDNKSFLWNRNRIRYALKRASYKGTIARLSDDMVELGCESIQVTDNASKLLVLSRQGRLSEPDSYMVTANFWHDGAYQLKLVDSSVPSLVRAEVEPVMQKTVPAGTIWYLIYGRQLFSIWEMDFSLLHGQMLHSGNQRQGVLGYGNIITDYEADRNVFLSWMPNRQVQKSYFPIVWHQISNSDGGLNIGTLGDVFLSWYPSLAPQKTYYPIYYHESAALIGNIGDSILGELPLSWQPERGFQISEWHPKSILFECGPAVATEDSWHNIFGVFEVLATQSRYGIHQLDNYDEFESLGWATQITGYREGLAVAQGYLTGDSNLPGNIDDILGNEGDEAIPLTEYEAALQAGVQKTEEEP